LPTGLGNSLHNCFQPTPYNNPMEETTPAPRGELRRMGPPRCFGPQAREAAFPLGGIGTGNISLGARGDLRDWEVWNRPGKGQKLPYSFFAIAVDNGDHVDARVLEARLTPPYTGSHGFHPGTAAGLPRLENSRLQVRYPFAHVDLWDPGMPVKVRLEAYTPFIPHEPHDSGLPLASFTYTVRNTGETPLKVSVAASLLNAVGFTGLRDFGWLKPQELGQNVNTLKTQGPLTGLHFTSQKHSPDSPHYGSMALAVVGGDPTAKPYWLRSGWWDGFREFWDDFSHDGRLRSHGYETPTAEGETQPGSLSLTRELAPGESRDYQFLLAWYFPNRRRNWNQRLETSETVRNMYATRFEDAWEVCTYYVETREHLEGMSRAFTQALYNSTLPTHVIEAAANNITCLRSNTCFWLEDGRFLAYEGCFDDAGCCAGSCTHVWNYEQTLAYLFPSLERSMRETEFLVETDEEGRMSFRAFKAFPGERSWDVVEAAADGQCGSIMRLYREWVLSGDTQWMLGLYPHAKRAMEYACKTWDPDGDGVPEARQHNTYDISFYGPNPLSGVMFLGALKAFSQMAEAAGDKQAAERFLGLYRSGWEKLDRLLWNGEYYHQSLEDVDQYKYQHGSGCLSDQLLGQLNASLMGLGHLLPQPHIQKALQSIHRYNFKTNLAHHDNTQRTYALNEEAGLLLCTWPQGGRPRLPFVYSHEVWPGVEYQVASHLILEGMVDEGLALAKAVVDRYDGTKRNPWDEVECGHHYARSMASWGLILSLSGFQPPTPRSPLGFQPRLDCDPFKTFWSTGTAWGTATLTRKQGRWTLVELQVIHGGLANHPA